MNGKLLSILDSSVQIVASPFTDLIANTLAVRYPGSELVGQSPLIMLLCSNQWNLTHNSPSSGIQLLICGLLEHNRSG